MLYNKSQKLDYVSVLIILFSSGTLVFYYQHPSIMCFVLFFWGIFMFHKRHKGFKSLFSYPSTKFAVSFVIWIWFNFLFINTNHSDRAVQPIVYSLIILGTNFICISLSIEKYKKCLLNLLSVICSVSILIYVLYNMGAVPTRVIPSPDGEEGKLAVLFDCVMGTRLCSIWWEPSALQVVVNLTILLYFPELIRKELSRSTIFKFIPLIIALFLSMSTSGYIAFAILFSVIMYKRIDFKRNIIASVISIFIGFAIVYAIAYSSTVEDKLSQDYGTGVKSGSLNTRLSDNVALLMMISERPTFGWGLNSVEYNTRSWELNNWSSSNGVLDFITRFGIPVMLFYFISAYKSLKRKNLLLSPLLSLILFIFVNCFNGMIIHSFVWAMILDFNKVGNNSFK